jgi:hypothetical protein
MKSIKMLLAFSGCVLLTVAAHGVSGVSASSVPAGAEPVASLSRQDSNKLIYADFETSNNGRPVSSRGGWVQINAGAETPSRPSTFKGMASPNDNAPDIVRPSKDSPNKAIAFDYQLQGPNQWANVGVEVHGLPDKDGKPAADDVTGYKDLSLQVYATGLPALKVILNSHGNGITTNAYPELTFKVTPGFNTYHIILKALGQPQWGDPRVNAKDVLKNLTSVIVMASCGPCNSSKGTIVIDNMVFEK